MIVYSLTCSDNHEFEAWFKDSAAFDEQRAQKVVLCPSCGSDDVRKAVMAPRISRSRTEAPLPSEPTGKEVPAVSATTARREELQRLLVELRQHVEANCDYVGDRFAEEARRIHYGEADARDIYGETTPDEARNLLEEGVKVAPLPPLPRRNN